MNKRRIFIIVSLSLFFSLALFLSNSQRAISAEIPDPNYRYDIFEFKNVDLRGVLKAISRKTGVNIVCGPEVRAQVDIRLEDVAWRQALDIVLDAYGFGCEERAGVLVINSFERMAEKQAKEPVVTEALALNYGQAEEISASIKDLLSKQGKAAYDERTNTLIITDRAGVIRTVKKLLPQLDARTKQILIKAKIIEIEDDSVDELGLDWGFLGGGGGEETPYTGGKTVTVGGMNSPYGISKVNLFRTATLSINDVESTIKMLRTTKKARLVSEPSIATTENKEAKILVGSRIPIPTYDFSDETGERVISGYDEEEVGVKLSVTPRVNQEGFITLAVNPEVSYTSGGTGPDDERPIIVTREAETEVMIKQGQTLVIGGMIQNNQDNQARGIPILRDIPIIGEFFKFRTNDGEKTELMIFITPDIMESDEGQLAQE